MYNGGFGEGAGLLAYNVYAYCANNPVVFKDETGESITLACVLIGAGIGLIVGAVGAAKGATIGFAVGAATGAATGAAGGAISHRISTGSWSGADKAALNSMANGALSGAITGAITGGIKGGKSYTPKTTTSPVSSNTTNTLNIKYPRDNPTKCNIPDFKWRGSGTPASRQGNFVNVKTGEWLHPDLNHGPPIGPHWDYGVRGSSQTFRIFPDGNILPK